MNERIRELERQATETVKCGLNGTSTAESFNRKKFAELIVAECIKQINKVEKKGDAHLGGGYFYDGTQLCRDAIKQHFGVKE